MTQKLTLYVGDQSQHTRLIRLLGEWSIRHPEIDFSIESVHVDPALVVQLRVTRLPALIFEGHIVAQGNPGVWLPHFLDQGLLSHGSSDG